MGFRYRPPSIKIGGMTIRKNKKGFSISGKTLTGARRTYNTGTGKTTTTYKTGIPGLSYRTVSDSKPGTSNGGSGAGCLTMCLSMMVMLAAAISGILQILA